MDGVNKPTYSNRDGDLSDEDSLKKEAIAGASLPSPPSVDGEEANRFDSSDIEGSKIIKKSKIGSAKNAAISKLFGDDYNIMEVYFILFAACLIAVNSGFVNGTTMSGLLINDEKHPPTSRNPDNQMVAGFAGAYTNTAIAMVTHEWETYIYNLCIILSYMGGSFIAALMCPHAKPYVLEPRYGPTFWIGGTMLLVASLLAWYEIQSRYVFFLVTASNGIQNGIASIYSANLIRCTLTGATTDLAIVVAQSLNGNYKGLPRGCVLAMICFCFWFGGILSVYGVRKLKTTTLMVNALVFYLNGLVIVVYLVKYVGVSFTEAMTGSWKWKTVLKKLDNSDGKLTKEKLLHIFDQIDQEGDGNGEIDLDELTSGLQMAGVKMKPYEMARLFRAADEDGDGVITRDEWRHLADKVL